VSVVDPSGKTVLTASTTPDAERRPPSAVGQSRSGMAAISTVGTCAPRVSGGRPVAFATAHDSTAIFVPSRKEL
jgi:hypothetical protein